jgi:hypothetical protein
VNGSGKPANLRCLTGSPNGFPEIPARLSILRQVPHRHFDVDKNCGKRIIEKVRDTRRQAIPAFRFLKRLISVCAFRIFAYQWFR